ncbi:MAG: hypothetical protein WBE38_12240 [Terracidiphilus sp.]|jgi:hypothetical protein
MKPHRAIAFLLLFPAALLVQAKDKKQSGVPAVFGQARYVFVEAVDGQEFDPNLYPEDREAIADVRDALQNWKRYALTTERDQADLVFVVRKGRVASADVGVSPRSSGPGSGGQGSSGPGSVGSGSGSPGWGGSGGAQIPGQGRSGGQMGGPGIQTGGEMGPPDDFFEVCQVTPNGKLSSPLWERSMPDGLDAPRVLLFRQFQEAVEKAYPSQPAPQAQKP